MTAVVLSDSAKANIARIALRYEMEKDGLGNKFLNRVDEAIGRIEESTRLRQGNQERPAKQIFSSFRKHYGSS